MSCWKHCRTPSLLTDEDLPFAGIFIRSEADLTPVIDAPFRARTLNASIVLRRLYPGTQRHEAPGASVGAVLSSFSRFLQEKLMEAYNKARAIPDQLQRR